MHGRFGLTLFLMCSLPAFLPAGVHAETHRALLVGIDKYEPKQTATAAAAAGKPVVGEANPSPSNTPPTRGTWFDLDGAVNDVEAVRAILLARYGFQPGNVRVLRNGEATRDRILAEIRRHLIAPVVPGDVAVFFYAGHGSQVNNSQSSELDKKDETIVPADASQGAWDIRDKELRRLFNDILDKGASLTVFFDSCHSGSIARGLARAEKARFLPPDPRDIAAVVGAETPDPRPAPEERGALVFSAAQDFELANEDTEEETGGKHGAFTLALLKALKTAKAQESAENVFLRTKALIRKAQEPVLAGPAGRRQKPLFGSGAGVSAEGNRIAVRRIRDDGTVELQGGLAVGLREKCELKKVDVPAGAQAVRLRVEKVQGWSDATARVIAGEAKMVRPGDLFVMDLWAAPNRPFLRVWIPPTATSPGDLQHLTEEVSALRTSKEIEWINDPTEDTPTHRLEWNGAVWIIVKPGGQEDHLGKAFTAQQVLETLAMGAKEKAKL
ncbi:MAG TPA: caspase family protein, partial [Candidatus Binatia bacterium]|nr:caspase family protein [Candidatus Binatia bacterium]